MSTFRLYTILFSLYYLLAAGSAVSAAHIFAAKNGKHGGTVVIGMKGDFDSFNELNAGDADALQVINNMLFMTLTRLDENLEIVPYLATSWEFAPGDTVLTFHLRKDVFWTDGKPTMAEDVLFTYTVATNPDYAYPAASRFDFVEKVEVIDDFTVRFQLKKSWPDVLLDTQMPILPKHIIENVSPEKMAGAPFNRQPLGNGPFILKEWQTNQKLVFEANPKFALGRPHLDRVVFIILPDEAVLLSNLMTGEIDVVSALTPQQKLQLHQNQQIRLLQYPSHGYTFVAWNFADARLSRTVRQALTSAINRKEIIETLLEGLGQPIHGPLMPFTWAYDKNLWGFSYDLTQAKDLLAQDGWRDTDGDGVVDKNGEPFELTLKTNAESRLRTDVAVMIQAQLKKIGVKSKVEPVEWNALLQQVFEQRDFEGLILGWDADFTVDPTPLWHSKSIENGYNFIGYANPRIDNLIEKGRNATNRKAAKAHWDAFQKIIVADCPYTFLFKKDNLAGVSTRVKDVRMDVRGFLANINEWWIPQRSRKFGK